VPGFVLARHHADAQFYFLDCTFSKNMIDRPPKRVIYPIGNDKPSDTDAKRNADNDKKNLWGERAYFFNCHRDDGDFDWFKDNLSAAPGSPKVENITAAWTFAGKWDPENRLGPHITRIEAKGDSIEVTFNESVTAKGKPQLTLKNGQTAVYVSGSGGEKLVFKTKDSNSGEVQAMGISAGAIIASQAAATIRVADLSNANINNGK
jgi:pectinesterase